MKIRIPNHFRLFNTKIKVVFNNRKLTKKAAIGLSELSKSRITLASEFDRKPISLDAIHDTYYHEKVHMILDMMGERKLSRNEKFVEVFSKLLRQSDETATFNK